MLANGFTVADAAAHLTLASDEVESLIASNVLVLEVAQADAGA
jgi:hypothetical protein